MADETGLKVPQAVHIAALNAWEKIARGIPATSASTNTGTGATAQNPHSVAHLSYVDEMLAKINRRMQEYPEWYETDTDKITAEVVRQLERIGEVLKRELPKTTDAVPVWEIPLSVFNRLTPEPPGFVRHSLCAWSRAQDFNAANSGKRIELRQRFFDIAPPLLRAVTGPILEDGFWVFFSQKSTGSEYTHLLMRVQRSRD